MWLQLKFNRIMQSKFTKTFKQGGAPGAPVLDPPLVGELMKDIGINYF